MIKCINGDNMRMGIIEKLKWKIEEFIKKRKNEKEKKKKELEEIRLWQRTHGVRSYSKPQVFLFTILGLFVGVFETKANSKNKEPVLNMKNPKAVSVMQEDEKKITEIVLRVQVIEEEIEKEKEVSKIISYQEELKEKKKKIKEVKEKYPEIEYNSKTIPAVLKEAVIAQSLIKKAIQKTNEVIERASQRGREIVVEEKKKEEEKLQKLKIEKKENDLKVQKATKTMVEWEEDSATKKEEGKRKSKVTNEESLDHTQILSVAGVISASTLVASAVIVKKEETKILGKKEKKEVNQKLVKIQLEKIEEKIKETKDPILLEECTRKLQEIKEKEEEKEIKEKCEELQKLAEIKKEELKPKKAVRTENDLAEILYMEALIHNHIRNQKKEIRKFQKRISKLEPIQKRVGFLGGIKSFLSKSIQLTFSLFPIALFKNKKLGLLTSAVLVNNSIRSMRNAMNRVQIPYVEYEKIAETIRESKLETEKTQMLCYDSLEQISYLKADFLREVGYDMSPDVAEILKEMDQLEKMIESRTKELEKVNGVLVMASQKSKQKIKRMEDMYGRY